MAVRRNTGISVKQFSPVSPHLGVLDILFMEQPYHVLACYAPTHPKERRTFFQQLTTQIIPDSTIVMGDLNSVRILKDRTSRQDNSTTDLLNGMCEQFNLIEPHGSNFYTYQHPSLWHRSRIDYIMGPLAFIGNLTLTGWWTSLLDHQVLIATPCLDDDKGPRLWKFPDDILNDENFVKEIETLLNGEDPKLDIQVIWETLKLDIKMKTQQFTKFHRKQHKSKLSSLQRLLHAVNFRIYQGEDLHCDAS